MKSWPIVAIAVSAMAAGAVRVGVIALLEALRAPEGIWVSVYFAAGVGCSFTTNFLLNRFFVFKR